MAKPPRKPRTVAEVVKSVERSAARRKRAREKLAAEIAARVPGEGYEPCIVSFIDVLGFRDLLATRHAHDIRDIMLRLRKFTTPDAIDKPRRMKDARLFSQPFADSVSDAVVRVRVFDTQYRDGAFFHELLDLLHAQIQCVGSGVVIRAGVTIGDAHVGLDGKGPVFGPAMVRAYEIETHEAIHPRIVVDRSAYDTFLTDTRLHKEGHSAKMETGYVDKLLRVDADGVRFIDYLAASESEFDHPGGYFEFLGQHAELVRDKLATTTGKVRAKFEWLAGYHNSVVAQIIDEVTSGARSSEAFLEEFDCEPLPLLHAMAVEV
ncbi:MAG: hypothetical protein J7500_03060 [Sphingomonas sp.]|uniref:hypothetical protein n=1 Tax=Sphingomonas sp. TaxID=28214 RepID=UPI001B21F8FC|nr:hypothetical protein [Sphingomonas sp.]MBO9621670.1 hypothetical protein [Sphingomonas sp.]